MTGKESIKAKFRSFVEGIAYLGGFLDPMYPYEGLSPKEVDTGALASDWQAVGDDIRIAMRQFEDSVTPPPPVQKNRL